MKSLITSVAFPAWVMGHDPAKRIICISYAEDLARKLSVDTRNVLETSWHRELFPKMRLASKRPRNTELITSMHGSRFAAGVGGAILGRGADLTPDGASTCPSCGSALFGRPADTAAAAYKFGPTSCDRVSSKQDSLPLRRRQQLWAVPISCAAVQGPCSSPARIGSWRSSGPPSGSRCEPPLLPILLGRQALAPQVALQRLVALPVLEADEVVGCDRLLRVHRRSGLRCFWSVNGTAQSGCRATTRHHRRWTGLGWSTGVRISLCRPTVFGVRPRRRKRLRGCAPRDRGLRNRESARVAGAVARAIRRPAAPSG
jgi:hypothetical protein